MLLRTRITLIVALAFITLMLGLWGAALLRDRVAENRENQVAIAGQTVLWREIVAFQTSNLSRILERVDSSSAFRIALGFADHPGIAAALKEAGVDIADPETAFEVVGADHELIFGSGGSKRNRSILDAGSLDQALKGKVVTGLRQVGASRIVVLSTRTVLLSNKGPAVLVLGRDASIGMDRFARGIGASTTLVTVRGRVVASTDIRLWERAKLDIAPRQAMADRAEIQGHSYNVISVPVEDVGGGTIGALVSLIDTTETLKETGFIRHASIAGAVAVLLLGVIGLNVFLWYSFRPLEEAIDVLQALARGDTSVTVEHTGSDEIGRIASAVLALRANVQALAEARRQRERVRRRQGAVISSELKALADSIDPTDREEVLSLLADNSRLEKDDELKRVARVLHDLSHSIIDWQNNTLKYRH